MSFLSQLNDEQRRAAEKIEGPVLILAGAGSGKTRTITYRMAHMIKELGISPLNILALTFTNKAAKEMKERAEQLIGDEAGSLVVSTFHSFSVRLLKTYSERIGYSRNFNIYDVDDQKSILNKIKKEFNIINDDLTPAKLANKISKLKEEGITVEGLEKEIDIRIPANRLFRDIYQKYTEVLKANNAMDFSDLLFNAKKVLEDPFVLERVQDRYRYIMVDEYQDTNDIQYQIVSMIASKYQNLCVVGDEDQSIYAFRGANINNILNFERDYKDAFVAKLERNYRSTKTILDAANEIIKNNKSSKGKKLWTDRAVGEKIKIYNALNANDEAEFIVQEIKGKNNIGVSYKDMTILYRTNAQSRILEEKLLTYNIPYKIYGGMQFFQRKEIKDILAYMNLLNNKNDNHNFLRIINVPKRSIGEKTLERISEVANEKGLPLLDTLFYIDEIDGIRAGTKLVLKDFYNMMMEIYEELDMMTDSMEEDENFVKLMTIHSSKGLEFDYVYLAGMEEGLFPSISYYDVSEEEIEEERRLCYVAITRAKKELIITHASERMKWGQTEMFVKPSRFIFEMDQKCLEFLNSKQNRVINESAKFSSELNTKARISTTSKIENFNPFTGKGGIIEKKMSPKATDGKYKVGDLVNHIKFGKGRIRAIDEKSLTIEFIAGQKKLALVLADKFLVD